MAEHDPENTTRQEHALAALTLFNKCEYLVRTVRGLDPEPRFRGAAGRELRDAILSLMNLEEHEIDALLQQAKDGSLTTLPELPMPPKVARRTAGRQWGLHRAMLNVGGTYSPEVVFGLLGDRDLLFDGFLVSMRSIRYQLFQIQPACVTCGVRGTMFRLTTPATPTGSTPPRAHFNLWGSHNGTEVMLTKDHVIPEVRGGPAQLPNLQTMCTTCNAKKGSKISEPLDAYLRMWQSWRDTRNPATALRLEELRQQLTPTEQRATTTVCR